MNIQTGSEPTTPSFGPYKISNMDPTLNKIDKCLKNIATCLGINFISWKIITDLKLLKKEDQFHVNTMRCMQLMDDQFNMMNAYIDRRTLAHAEKAKALSPDQYGSQKRHIFINAVLNKVLLKDIVQLKKEQQY